MHLVAPDTLEGADFESERVSALAHHGPCCDRARDWLIAMGRSLDYASTDMLAFAGPHWLTRRFAWGPTAWPIAWCEAVQKRSIDCGVFSAFALELFRAKGVEAYPGIALCECAEESAAHYRRRWALVSGAGEGIGTRIVRRDVTVVRVARHHAKVYDPAAGVWFEPRSELGHGAVVAIRAELPLPLRWGDYPLEQGRWTQMGPSLQSAS